jgi:hypothetical protein
MWEGQGNGGEFLIFSFQFSVFSVWRFGRAREWEGQGNGRGKGMEGAREWKGQGNGRGKGMEGAREWKGQGNGKETAVRDGAKGKRRRVSALQSVDITPLSAYKSTGAI